LDGSPRPLPGPARPADVAASNAPESASKWSRRSEMLRSEVSKRLATAQAD